MIELKYMMLFFTLLATFACQSCILSPIFCFFCFCELILAKFGTYCLSAKYGCFLNKTHIKHAFFSHFLHFVCAFICVLYCFFVCSPCGLLRKQSYLAEKQYVRLGGVLLLKCDCRLQNIKKKTKKKQQKVMQ